MGYLEAINRRLSSPTFIIIGERGEGKRIEDLCAQFSILQHAIASLSHTGERKNPRDRERAFPAFQA